LRGFKTIFGALFSENGFVLQGRNREVCGLNRPANADEIPLFLLIPA